MFEAINDAGTHSNTRLIVKTGDAPCSQQRGDCPLIAIIAFPCGFVNSTGELITSVRLDLQQATNEAAVIDIPGGSGSQQ